MGGEGINNTFLSRMIEEYMLLANMTVARRIHGKFPEGAMLRRHPSPREMVLEDLVSRGVCN